MSFARWGNDSDVYVYESARGLEVHVARRRRRLNPPPPWGWGLRWPDCWVRRPRWFWRALTWLHWRVSDAFGYVRLDDEIGGTSRTFKANAPGYLEAVGWLHHQQARYGLVFPAHLIDSLRDEAEQLAQGRTVQTRIDIEPTCQEPG